MNFTNRTTDYNGNPAEIETGVADILVDFYVSVPDPDNEGDVIDAPAGVSVLKLYVRKSGSGIPFKMVREDTKSTAYKFAATGWDYYFTWEIKAPITGLTASVDAS